MQTFSQVRRVPYKRVIPAEDEWRVRYGEVVKYGHNQYKLHLNMTCVKLARLVNTQVTLSVVDCDSDGYPVLEDGTTIKTAIRVAFDSYQYYDDLFIEKTGIPLIKVPRNGLVDVLIDINVRKNLRIFKTPDDALYVHKSIMSPLTLEHECDECVELDVNSMYGYAMLGKMPYGAYKRFDVNDLSETELASMLDMLHSEEYLGFIEVEELAKGDDYLFESLPVMPSPAYFDGIKRGFRYLIKSLMIFEYADYILRDAILKVYSLRSVNNDLNIYAKKEIVSFYGRTSKVAMLHRAHPSMSSPLYLTSFILYRYRAHLMQLINDTFIDRPTYINVDAVHSTLSNIKSYVHVGNDIGMFKLSQVPNRVAHVPRSNEEDSCSD